MAVALFAGQRCDPLQALAYKDSRAFHGFGTRGLGGTNVALPCLEVGPRVQGPAEQGRPWMDS